MARLLSPVIFEESRSNTIRQFLCLSQLLLVLAAMLCMPAVLSKTMAQEFFPGPPVPTGEGKLSAKFKGVISSQASGAPVSDAVICWLPYDSKVRAEHFADPLFFNRDKAVSLIGNSGYVHETNTLKRVSSQSDGSYEVSISIQSLASFIPRAAVTGQGRYAFHTGTLVVWAPGHEAFIKRLSYEKFSKEEKAPLDLNFELSPGGVITGKVLTRDGKPAVGMRVGAIPSTGNNAFNSPFECKWSASVGADGSYRFDGLPFETYNVTPLCGDSKFCPLPYQAESVLELSKANSMLSIDYPARLGGVIKGRVVDEQGNGISGEKIVLHYTDLQELSHSVLAQTGRGGMANLDILTGFTAISSADGYFKFAGVPTIKSYLIEIVSEHYAVFQSQDILIEPEPAVVDLTLTLIKGYSVSGRVYPKEGKPEFTSLTLLTDDDSPLTPRCSDFLIMSKAKSTDEDGNFLIKNLAPGKYLLLDGCPDFEDLLLKRIDKLKFTRFEVIDRDIENLKMPIKNPRPK